MAKISKTSRPLLLGLVLCLVLLLPLLWPLVQPGFFATDDGNWMIIRLASFYQTLRGGQFPVRFLWSLNHGYGYPVANFLYPLPFYLGSLLHLFRLSFVDSVKALLALSYIFGAIGVFCYSWQKNKNYPLSLFAALLYSYFPYRGFDVYTRGSLGESLALGFAPFIFLGLEKVRSSPPIAVAVTALATFATITSHNTLGLMFFLLVASKIVFDYLTNKVISELFLKTTALLIGLAITSFFTLPAILELSQTVAPNVQVANPSQYFINLGGVLGYLIGLAIVPFWVIVKNWRKNADQVFYIFVFIISLLLASDLTASWWNLALLQHIVQFPWRTLAVADLALALIAANQLKSNKISSLLMTVILLFFAIPQIAMVRNVAHTTYPDSFYSTNDDTTTVKNEYMPKWVAKNPTQQPNGPYTILSGAGSVQQNNLSLASGAKIQANVVYFPGIKVLANNSPVVYTYLQGFPVFDLPKGNYILKTTFVETPLRVVANLISLLSLGTLIIFVISLKPRHD